MSLSFCHLCHGDMKRRKKAYLSLEIFPAELERIGSSICQKGVIGKILNENRTIRAAWHINLYRLLRKSVYFMFQLTAGACQVQGILV